MNDRNRDSRPALRTLVIDRFEVPVDLANNAQCGGVDDTFQVSCKLSARKLTDDGYVVEVRSFMQTVEAAFGRRDRMLKASCEELADGVVHLAVNEVGSRLMHVEVEVENLTGRVQVAWEKGDAVPNFPRQATEEERRATLSARECDPDWRRHREPC